MQIPRVNPAAKFAVASELSRRNLCAQLTDGHRKGLDLLIVRQGASPLRIKV